MKKVFYCVALCGMLLYGCGAEKPVRIENVNGEDLYVCDYFKTSDSTVTVNLSDLVKSLEVVKLDSDTAATVGGGGVHFSDNYMLIQAGYQQPVKMFDRQGNYLRNIGKVGRGPGEYLSLYDIQLDEKNNRIFFMPWQTRYLYEYNMEGEFVKPIRMVGGAPKAKFTVEGNRLTVLALPFKGLKWVAFQQTLDGELLDSVPVGHFEINERNPYNNELFGSRDNHYVHIFRSMGKIQDTLYHYVPGKNGFIPKFTVDFGTMEPPIHQYREFGDYFFFETNVTKPTGENTFTYVTEKSILVNKKTRDATRFKIVNDLLGGYETNVWCFSDGYYIENLSPDRLKDKLEKVIEKGGLDKAMEKKITDLVNSIDENDNNYVIYGQLK